LAQILRACFCASQRARDDIVPPGAGQDKIAAAVLNEMTEEADDKESATRRRRGAPGAIGKESRWLLPASNS